jgi:hypothetical protein
MSRGNQISVVELKRLLVDLKEKKPDIGVRFRLLGHLWSRNFCRIIAVTENGVTVNEEPDNKICTIPHLGNIIQFELDSAFTNFQPFNHYDVSPFSDF